MAVKTQGTQLYIIDPDASGGAKGCRMMKTYTLIKTGVYIQELYGVFSSREKALDRFNTFYKEQVVDNFDGYHDFYIVESTVDQCDIELGEPIKYKIL